MSSTRPALALMALVPLASCALVGPLVDRQMDDAPYAACTRFEPDGALSGQIQCFALLERGPNGGFVPRASRTSRRATRSSPPSPRRPSARALSRTSSSAAATGPGEMTIEVPDAVGRAAIGRTVDWEEARTGRRWAVSDIDTPLHIPGGIRLHLLEGEVQLTSLCYKAYGDIDL